MSKIWQDGTRIHVPVMPNEVLYHLNILKDGTYLDGTIGLGGHSSLILSRLSAKGHLIGIDRDEEAIEICKKITWKFLTKLKFSKSFTMFHVKQWNSLLSIIIF